MTTPILAPIIANAGFDPVWFGVILTINMEMGLITPPVGLNLYVINGIAPGGTVGGAATKCGDARAARTSSRSSRLKTSGSSTHSTS